MIECTDMQFLFRKENFSKERCIEFINALKQKFNLKDEDFDGEAFLIDKGFYDEKDYFKSVLNAFFVLDENKKKEYLSFAFPNINVTKP